MPNYVTLGSNRLPEAVKFYDGLMAEIGWSPIMDHGSGGRVYAGAGGMFAVVKPYDGEAATVGNGTMVGFALESREQVASFHAKALALGGSDEGAPGLRGPDGENAAYMSYVRDLDGNKICAFKLG